MKRALPLLLIALSLTLLTAWGYLTHSRLLEPIDRKLSDLFFVARGPVPADPNIVIVDVDEKSLQALGQWPWPRDRIATIVKRLGEAEAALVVFDVVFAETDRTSSNRGHEASSDAPDSPPDHDRTLAQAFRSAPVVAGYFFDFSPDTVTSHNAGPPLSALILEKGEVANRNFLPRARGVITNIPPLQNGALSSGFVNTLPDTDGVVRFMPLLLRYRDTPYPSLALETVRLLLGTRKIVVEYASTGVSRLRIGSLPVESDRFGRIRLNYRGERGSYPYLSACDIHEGRFDPSAVAGKIVLFGSSASGLLDLRATPYSGTFPGIEIQATAVDNLLHGDYLIEPDWIESAEILAMFLLSVALALIFYFTSPLAAGFFAGALVLFWYLGAYELFLKRHIVVNLIFPTLLFVGTLFSLTLYNYFFESRQRGIIRKKFARKVSDPVVEELLRSSDDEIFAAKERVVTIFFSDIRGFTKLAERLENPRVLVETLNRYLDPMTRAVLKHGGIVDKFIGDAIMAYWNAPVDLPHHEEAAVRCALEQLETLEKINETFEREGLPTLRIGIGIHTGSAVVGEMGSKDRSDYTIIGDSVNLASRIEGLNKHYGTTLLVSETTFVGLGDSFVGRKIDTVRVKGKKEPVTLYEILGEGEPAEALKEELALHARALEAYEKREVDEALELFTRLEAMHPHKLYAHFRWRCLEAKRIDAARYDPVFTLDDK